MGALILGLEMGINFRPYLKIRDKDHLQSLLKNQTYVNENYYSFSKNDCFSKKDFEKEVALVKNFYGYTPKEEDEKFVNELIYHILIFCYYRETGHSYSQILFLYFLIKDEHKDMIDLKNFTIGNLVNGYSKKPEQYFKVLSDELISFNEFIKKYYKDVYTITIKKGVDIFNMDIVSFIDFMEFILSTFFSIISYNEDRIIKQLFINLTFANVSQINKMKEEIISIIRNNEDYFRNI